jgi:arylsulfatase A-like enzyme
MRLPGVIPANTVIKAPAGHIDLFSTILDYCGQAASPSEGRSLRPLIEGKEETQERFAVSEWASQGVPGYMLYDGRWKFMYGRSAAAPSLDALYDLQNDPSELNNLIGRNARAEQHRTEVVRMKGLLVEWLTRVQSPNLESVKARPLFATSARR